jgi:hypothetical protein
MKKIKYEKEKIKVYQAIIKYVLVNNYYCILVEIHRAQPTELSSTSRVVDSGFPLD